MFPTGFDGCPSEVGWIGFVGRCQISDQAWKPDIPITAHGILRRFFLHVIPCYGGCARETFGSAGFDGISGFPDRAWLPPFRLETKMAAL
jgi:hypothetical protein